MTEKIHYTNDQLKADLHEINRQMHLTDFTPDVIVGVARGGLVPATMLSHYHAKPLQVINYSLRDNQIPNNHRDDLLAIYKLMTERQNKILIVDDICDSGETLKEIVDTLKEGLPIEWFNDFCKSAVLWNNIGQDVFDPDFVGREINRVDDERWVIFPYEEWWRV